MAVFHSETLRNCAQLNKSQPFVKMAGVNIAFYNGVELKYAVTAFFCLQEAVFYEKFADVLSSGV